MPSGGESRRRGRGGGLDPAGVRRTSTGPGVPCGSGSIALQDGEQLDVLGVREQVRDAGGADAVTAVVQQR